MTDVLTLEQRKYCMSKIRGKNTKPELLIRKGLFARGFRFRLHCKNLAGKPDLVFPKYKSVILINGCFWHGHECLLFKWPSSRKEFWKKKITRNREKDVENLKALKRSKWRVLTIWECALKGKSRLLLKDVIEETASWLVSNKKHHLVEGYRKNKKTIAK